MLLLKLGSLYGQVVHPCLDIRDGGVGDLCHAIDQADEDVIDICLSGFDLLQLIWIVIVGQHISNYFVQHFGICHLAKPGRELQDNVFLLDMVCLTVLGPFAAQIIAMLGAAVSDPLYASSVLSGVIALVTGHLPAASITDKDISKAAYLLSGATPQLVSSFEFCKNKIGVLPVAGIGIRIDNLDLPPLFGPLLMLDSPPETDLGQRSTQLELVACNQVSCAV
jgi:hypothetical protein